MDHEEMIALLERNSNMLLGMTMDLRIPKETRECLRKSSQDIDKVVAELNDTQD